MTDQNVNDRVPAPSTEAGRAFEGSPAMSEGPPTLRQEAVRLLHALAFADEGIAAEAMAVADRIQDGEKWAGRAVQDDGLPTVEELAQIIRQVDGDHSLGSGALAEQILDRLRAAPPLHNHD